MKKFIFLIATSMLFASCGGGDNTKKFAPKDRTTVEMSDAERNAAIEAKKAAYGVDMNVALNSNDVKLSVMPPLPNGDITEELAERISVKMLHLTTANGIGGLNNVPGFALCASIAQTDKKVTSTAPQKMVTAYTLSYSVRNLVTDDVYATYEQNITGVGGSFEEATRNAINSVENNAGIQKMLSTASEKIINWYNENLPTLKGQIEKAIASNDYAYALALIESIPQKATEAFEYGNSILPNLLTKFKTQNANKELIALKQAINTAGNELSADVYAHLQLIPADSPEYAEAQKLCSEYEAKVIAYKETQENRKIAEVEAEKIRNQEIELAKIESERILAQYQAEATDKKIKELTKELEYERKGFWGTLGSKIIGGLDTLGEKMEELDASAKTNK